MTRKVNQALWDQWRRRIERQRGSDHSIAEFCRREGVSQASFHAWKRKLGNSTLTRQPLARPASDGAFKTRGGTRSRRQAASTTGGFLAARGSAPSFLQLPVVGARSSPWIELALPDGTIIRVPQHNLTALQAVLRVLQSGGVNALAEEASHA